MRWASWALAAAGIIQYAAILAMDSSDYVSVDMAYLVMWLAVLGALALCYMSCWGCGYGGGCDCDHCGGCSSGDCCGNCGCYGPNVEMKRGHEHGEHGHEGHSH